MSHIVYAHQDIIFQAGEIAFHENRTWQATC